MRAAALAVGLIAGALPGWASSPAGDGDGYGYGYGYGDGDGYGGGDGYGADRTTPPRTP